MGRRVSTQRVDEIDGSTASQTVAFTIDHQRFEIDLSDANAAALRAVFAPYVAAGREADAGRNGARQNGSRDNGAPKSASKKSVSRKSVSRKSVSRKSTDQRSGPHNIAAQQKMPAAEMPAPEKPAGASTEPQRFASSSSTARSGGRSLPRTPSTASTASPIPEERTGAQTSPTRTSDDKPDAPVVPLHRRAIVATEIDVAAQRRRLMTGIGELLRVLAVATVTRATNRVVTVVAKAEARSSS